VSDTVTTATLTGVNSVFFSEFASDMKGRSLRGNATNLMPCSLEKEADSRGFFGILIQE